MMKKVEEEKKNPRTKQGAEVSKEAGEGEGRGGNWEEKKLVGMQFGMKIISFLKIESRCRRTESVVNVSDEYNV